MGTFLPFKFFTSRTILQEVFLSLPHPAWTIISPLRFPVKQGMTWPYLSRGPEGFPPTGTFVLSCRGNTPTPGQVCPTIPLRHDQPSSTSWPTILYVMADLIGHLSLQNFGGAGSVLHGAGTPPLWRRHPTSVAQASFYRWSLRRISAMHAFWWRRLPG